MFIDENMFRWSLILYIDPKSICFAGVQSAAVNVICELARKNPKNYLSLAPLFFKLMTSSTNNWVLIKIIKLVGTRFKTSYIFLKNL